MRVKLLNERLVILISDWKITSGCGTVKSEEG